MSEKAKREIARGLKYGKAAAYLNEAEFALEQTILHALRGNRSFTRKELAEEIKQDEETVREAVWHLINRNMVTFTDDWKIQANRTSA